jgi:hypothetical protein
MKRRNVQMAFVGEGTTTADTAAENLVKGDEAIDIEITGGKLMVVVAAGTPDGEIFEAAQRVGGELVLENGLRFSFEIEDGATGAQFTATPDGDREDIHAGLNSMPDIPGGA